MRGLGLFISSVCPVFLILTSHSGGCLLPIVLTASVSASGHCPCQSYLVTSILSLRNVNQPMGPSSYLKHALCFSVFKCPGFFVKVHGLLQFPSRSSSNTNLALPFYFKAFHGCSQQEAVTSLIFALIFVVVFSCLFVLLQLCCRLLRLEFEIWSSQWVWVGI